MRTETHDSATTCINEAYEEARAFHDEHLGEGGVGRLSEIVFMEVLRHKLCLLRKPPGMYG